MPEVDDSKSVNVKASESELDYLQRQQSPEFWQLKSKLEAAGIDTSELSIKPLYRDSRHLDPYEKSPFFNVFHIPTFDQKTRSLRSVPFWEELRKLADQTGYWPVINNSRELFWEPPYDERAYALWDPYDKESDHPPYEPREIQIEKFQNAIRQAEQLNVDQWFRERLAEEMKAMGVPISDLVSDWRKDASEIAPWFLSLAGMPSSSDWFKKWQTEQDRELWDLSIESWPQDVKAATDISTIGVCIDLVPTKFSWQIPGFSQFPPGNNYWGGAQDVHMAILKRWYTDYGAELVVSSGATYELQVSNPPTSKEAAMKLAVEHYLYCPDCVEQSSAPNTIKYRAAKLLNGRTWYFWWD